MKKSSLLLVATFCLLFIGCGRIHGPVEQVKAFADEKEEVISEMGKKLEANPTAAGVDEARKVFEAKKDSLKAKKEAIKTAPEGFNKDWHSLLMRTESRHAEMLRAIGIKFSADCYSKASDYELVKQCEEKWKALEKDFNETAKYYQS